MATLQAWHQSLVALGAVVSHEQSLARHSAALRSPSAEVPDWLRERCAPFSWQPSRQLIRSLRDYGRARQRSDAIATLQRRVMSSRVACLVKLVVPAIGLPSLIDLAGTRKGASRTGNAAALLHSCVNRAAF